MSEYTQSTGELYVQKVEDCQKTLKERWSSVGDHLSQLNTTLYGEDVTQAEIDSAVLKEVEYLQEVKGTLVKMRSDIQAFNSYQGFLLGACRYMEERLFSLSKLQLELKRVGSAEDTAPADLDQQTGETISSDFTDAGQGQKLRLLPQESSAGGANPKLDVPLRKLNISESSDGGNEEPFADLNGNRRPERVRTKIIPTRPNVKKTTEVIRPIRRTPPKPQLSSNFVEIVKKQDQRQATPEEPEITSFLIRRDTEAMLEKRAPEPPVLALSKGTLSILSHKA